MRLMYFVIIIGLLTASCKKRENEVFTVEMEARLNIPGGLDNILTHVFVIEDIPNIFEAVAQQNGYNVEDIARVNPATAEISGVFEQNTYSFIDRVAINITKTNDNTTSREIFFQEIIALNHTGPLQLFGSLVDIKPYLLEEGYDLEIEMRFRQPTTGLLENRLQFSFVAYDNE